VLEAPAYFFFLSGAKKGRIEPARPSGRVIRVGRQPYCEVPLDPYLDIPASGEHAQVVCEPTGGFTLHDANSSWGTYKNEQRVSAPVQITTGDVITFGRDDRGNVGPQVKFYLARDILRCRVCEGPVYKRHFKCTGCQQKVCLRCVVVQRRLCKACVLTVPSGGGSVTGSGSGRLGRQPAGQAPRGPAPIGPSPGGGGSLFGPPPAVTPPGMAPIRKTRMMPARNEIPSSSEIPVAGSGFPIRQPQAQRGVSGSGFPGTAPQQRPPAGSPFQPPNSPSTSSFKRLPPMPPAPPIASAARGRAGDLLYSLDVADPSATEPELKVPDLDSLEALPQPPAAPVAPRPATRPIPPQAVQPRAIQSPPAQRPSQRLAKKGEESKFDVQRPAAVPCDRCAKPLNTHDFFSCVQCSGRLCSSHRATAERCDRCAAPPPAAPSPFGAPSAPAPLPPLPGGALSDIPPTIRRSRAELDDTMADVGGAPAWGQPAADSGDDLARRPPGLGTDHGLAGMRFECPYCEHPLPSHARRCDSCKRDL
jgi:FHA domain-containing protein